ncbi:hypothetical protein TWF788_008053 [Orbilia oligospora]|uniref:Uncharacterized protein n=1 Tax=Orbilia oligospora TaxID=2813651 RepID=A0A6G1MP03_ORBOL|nr:hypothetical protein TWF788_008053 [Orbilia oligospora]KAF3212918.1 hypothetical protein TWF191_010393 [Orbilia oligospora]KAF3265635.1 hypothetical protein TWF192_000278 [Orbilia oligospora]
MAPEGSEIGRERELSTDIVGNASTSSVRRGRGRPPGSRSRSRPGESVSPIRRRHRHAWTTRTHPPTNSNSLSPSPTRRRGRPPGSRNKKKNENIRPEPHDERHGDIERPYDSSPSIPVPPSRRASLNGARLSDAGSLADPSLDHPFPRTIVQDHNSTNVRQRVEQIFAEMHGNEVRRVSENLSRMTINSFLPRSNSLQLPQHTILEPPHSNRVPYSRPSRRSRGPSNTATTHGPQQPELQPVIQATIESLEIRSEGYTTSDESMDLSSDDPVLIPEDPDWFILPDNPIDTPSSANADTMSTSQVSLTTDLDCVQCFDISRYICDHCSMMYNNSVVGEVQIFIL